MDALVDVNFAFALVNERHVFHRKVCGWLDSRPSGYQLGICRMVQMSLIRLLCNKAAMDGDPVTLPAAWKVYAGLVHDPVFGFFPEPAGFQSEWIRLCAPYGASPKVLSDAYMASMSIATGLEVVTTDRDFLNFKELKIQLVS